MLNLTPQDLNLPPKFKKWEGMQEDVIEKIVQSDKPLYMLDAPTGSGKSVIGVASSYIWRTDWLTTRALQGEKVTLPKRVIYVTRTKQLQDQLLKDFPGSRTIKGRVNFPCLLNPGKFPELTADDCPHHGEHNPCDYLARCPYLLAKKEALAADIAVLNESYFLAEANGPGQFSGADFVILDEIDSLENALMNSIAMHVSEDVLKQLDAGRPADWSDWRSWVLWWNQSITPRERKVALLAAAQNDMPENLWGDREIRLNRRLRRLDNFNNNLQTFMVETIRQMLNHSGVTAPFATGMVEITEAMKVTVTGKETPFVIQEHYDKTRQIDGYDLKPVSVRNFAQERLWKHGKRFLGMSGTILSPVVVARELGVQEVNYDYRQIPSPFDVAKRPIYYYPVVNMRKQNIDAGEAIPKILTTVDTLLKKYANAKVLIHTVSYPIATAIQRDQLDLKGNQRIMTHNSENRADQLELFKKSGQPLVMLSPSFDRGVDLPDDECRCIIVCKVPYLNLGDKQVAARLKAPGGDQWYVFKALQTLMQMTGRGVRNKQDWCDTWILDQQFGALLARTHQYIPQWWKDSIIRVETI